MENDYRKEFVLEGATARELYDLAGANQSGRPEDQAAIDQFWIATGFTEGFVYTTIEGLEHDRLDNDHHRYRFTAESTEPPIDKQAVEYAYLKGIELIQSMTLPMQPHIFRPIEQALQNAFSDGRRLAAQNLAMTESNPDQSEPPELTEWELEQINGGFNDAVKNIGDFMEPQPGTNMDEFKAEKDRIIAMGRVLFLRWQTEISHDLRDVPEDMGVALSHFVAMAASSFMMRNTTDAMANALHGSMFFSGEPDSPTKH